MIHLLGTYVTILCNWLIFWQNALYLYLDRSRMCLILQRTCCSSLVLKPRRLDQETSEEKVFIKAGQIARHLRTDSSTASWHLSTTGYLSSSSFDCYRNLDNWWIDRESSCPLDNFSTPLQHLAIYRGLKLDISSTPAIYRGYWNQNFQIWFLGQTFVFV